MRRSELLRALERVPPFTDPDPALEQVITPSEAAATLLATADRLEGLAERSVLDLGCGTGRLAIGAALLGAAPVRGVDVDPRAVATARSAALALGTSVDFAVRDVAEVRRSADLVVMNPPFGAQRAHADRPFWDRAFALADSRTFIAQRAVERGAHVIEVGPVPWTLPRTFAHHVRARVPLAVDLWAIRTEHHA